MIEFISILLSTAIIALGRIVYIHPSETKVVLNCLLGAVIGFFLLSTIYFQTRQNAYSTATLSSNVYPKYSASSHQFIIWDSSKESSFRDTALVRYQAELNVMGRINSNVTNLIIQDKNQNDIVAEYCSIAFLIVLILYFISWFSEHINKKAKKVSIIRNEADSL